MVSSEKDDLWHVRKGKGPRENKGLVQSGVYVLSSVICGPADLWCYRGCECWIPAAHVSGRRKHPGSEHGTENAAEEPGTACLDERRFRSPGEVLIWDGSLQQDVTKHCGGSGQPQTPFTLSLQHICPLVVALEEDGARIII